MENTDKLSFEVEYGILYDYFLGNDLKKIDAILDKYYIGDLQEAYDLLSDADKAEIESIISKYRKENYAAYFEYYMEPFMEEDVIDSIDDRNPEETVRDLDRLIRDLTAVKVGIINNCL